MHTSFVSEKSIALVWRCSVFWVIGGIFETCSVVGSVVGSVETSSVVGSVVSLRFSSAWFCSDGVSSDCSPSLVWRCCVCWVRGCVRSCVRGCVFETSVETSSVVCFVVSLRFSSALLFLLDCVSSPSLREKYWVAVSVSLYKTKVNGKS